jgi:hypothetical protein
VSSPAGWNTSATSSCPGSRQAYWNGTCELVPAHFSEVPRLLRETTGHDLVLASASPPDRHGYFSLGTNADYAASFIGETPFFLEVNERMPRTGGQNPIHVSQVAGWCRADYPLDETVRGRRTTGTRRSPRSSPNACRTVPASRSASAASPTRCSRPCATTAT